MLNENILINKAKLGDKDALNQLVGFYWKPVFRTAFYKVGNQEDAQEITQEAFIRAFRSLPQYQIAGSPFKAYLDRITLNLVADYWRKKGRVPQVVDIGGIDPPAAAGELPEARAISRETSGEIAAAIKQLPEEQRRTIELRIIAGLSVKAVAEALGKSEAAVKMLQQRALKNLRSLLAGRELTANLAGGEADVRRN